MLDAQTIATVKATIPLLVETDAKVNLPISTTVCLLITQNSKKFLT